MPCLRYLRFPTVPLLAALSALAFASRAARAQQPPPPPVAAYHPPVLALVSPAPGGSIPADQPVVVFRFAQGEPDDPIDAASFRVVVDGQDRSAAFHVTASEAWGALGVPSGSSAVGGTAPAATSGASTSAPTAATAGVHRISVRLCSIRGACAAVEASVRIDPDPAEPSASITAPDDSTAARSTGRRLLDLLLALGRKLLLH